MRNKDNDEGFFSFKKVIAIILIIIITIVAVATIASAYQQVPAGYIGVVLQWGNPVRTTGSGLQFITPFVESMAFVNTQTQSATAQESAASSDLQEVTTSVTVNYQVDPVYALQVYTTLRDQYQARVIIPAMQDALKASTAKYQATNLITQREDAKATFQNLLQDKLTQYHIIITSVSITDFQFSPSFTTAIEAKVTAEQNALAAQNQLQVVNFTAQQQIIQATANATATILTAQGKANATVIAANATATQVALIQSQLTPAYLEYLYAVGWNGALPIYWVSGENGTAPYLLISTNSGTTTVPTSTLNTATTNQQTQTGNTALPTVAVYENTTSSAVGDTIKLTAITTPAQSGLTITFYNNGSAIGTSITDNNGQAIFNYKRTDLSSYNFTGAIAT